MKFSLIEKKNMLATLFIIEHWLQKLNYVLDIFKKSEDLNLSIQRKSTKILTWSSRAKTRGVQRRHVCRVPEEKAKGSVKKDFVCFFTQKCIYIHIVCLKYKGTRRQMLNLWKHTLVVIKKTINLNYIPRMAYGLRFPMHIQT